MVLKMPGTWRAFSFFFHESWRCLEMHARTHARRDRARAGQDNNTDRSGKEVKAEESFHVLGPRGKSPVETKLGAVSWQQTKFFSF